jgi:hypothetical protein
MSAMGATYLRVPDLGRGLGTLISRDQITCPSAGRAFPAACACRVAWPWATMRGEPGVPACGRAETVKLRRG